MENPALNALARCLEALATLAGHLGRAQTFNLVTLIVVTIVGLTVFLMAKIAGNLVMQNAIVYYLGIYLAGLQMPWFFFLQYHAIRQQKDKP